MVRPARGNPIFEAIHGGFVTWTLETSRGFESDKIAAIAVPYLHGKGLDIGCGMRKVWPSAIGVDNGHHFGNMMQASIAGDGTDLSLFADNSLDYVFSSHTLEHFHRENVPDILREWARVLKVGGYLVLYLPSANLYPKCGEEGANPDHKWDIYPGDVEAIMRDEVAGGWCQVEKEERDQGAEYSLFLVFRKTKSGWSEDIWQRNPGGQKRALVCRFGAIGDQIVASSVLPGLKQAGYHITYMVTPESQVVMANDPHIDEWVVQAREFVPNVQLGAYWEAIKERYDHIVNLCESVEGSLLQLPGRIGHSYSQETRNRLFGSVNYLERTHDIAAVPHEFACKFYPTEEERAWARETRADMAGPVVAWAIHGTSAHKLYPWINVVAGWILKSTPLHLVLMGDDNEGAELQAGILDSLGDDVPRERLHAMAGKWSLRKSLTFVQYADCVVGPETGLMNAVCMERNRKVIYLSHSSPDNLTKHWVNTTVLTPNRERAPCYPCHMLHYGWDHCNKVEATSAAACASGIAPQEVMDAILDTFGARKAA